MNDEEKQNTEKGQKVSERVAGLILDQISNGDLTPGQRLPGNANWLNPWGLAVFRCAPLCRN